MMHLRFAPALALGALILTPVPAIAQATKAPARQPTKVELERAAANLRIFVSALQSDKIPEPVKTALFVCIYSNNFKQITEATDKVILDKKVDKNNPSMVVGAMAAVCGFKPGQMPAPAPAPKK